MVSPHQQPRHKSLQTICLSSYCTLRLMLCPCVKSHFPKANISNSKTQGSFSKSLWNTSKSTVPLSCISLSLSERYELAESISVPWCCQLQTEAEAKALSCEPHVGLWQLKLNKTKNTTWDFKGNFLLNFNHFETKRCILCTYMPVALHFSLIHKEPALSSGALPVYRYSDNKLVTHTGTQSTQSGT